jgi:hypothetical protein
MMVSVISGTNAISMKIAACILYAPASLNAGATLLKDCTMNLILSVLVGLAMAGTSGTKIETYATAHIQVRIPLNNNFLNI